MGQIAPPWTETCRYAGSRLIFRGDTAPLAGEFVAVIGGIEAFGRFVRVPFAEQVAERTGIRCVNLGAVHAGLDAMLADRVVIAATRRASAVVLTVPGAHEVRNAYYDVHLWRNDRVIRQSDALKVLFPEADFFAKHFVRHMLTDLHAISPERFARIRAALQRQWVDRMSALLDTIDRPTVLVWMGDRRPDQPTRSLGDGDPPFVTGWMLEAVMPKLAGEVRVQRGRHGARMHLRSMMLDADDARAALELPGQRAHDAVAARLSDILPDIVESAAPALQRRGSA